MDALHMHGVHKSNTVDNLPPSLNLNLFTVIPSGVNKSKAH
jgi:hypothetical protein